MAKDPLFKKVADHYLDFRKKYAIWGDSQVMKPTYLAATERTPAQPGAAPAPPASSRSATGSKQRDAACSRARIRIGRAGLAGLPWRCR